ncbi:MAG: hypothetical protein ACQEP1_03905 [Nanobdellota archaeon]
MENRITKKIKKAFKKVKSEFDEHLDTINQNTNEIQANYEFLCELDKKVDKLTQRVDKLQMTLEGKKSKHSSVGRLTNREQEVFMALYTNEDGELTFKEIGRKLGFKEDMVRNYVMSLSEKGVPIYKKTLNGTSYIYLDSEFRDYQTRENVLEINEDLARQFV